MKAILYFRSFGCSLGCSSNCIRHCDFPAKGKPPSFQPLSAFECTAAVTGGNLQRCVSREVGRDCRYQAPDFEVELGRFGCCRLQLPSMGSRRLSLENCAGIVISLRGRRRVVAWC